MKFRILGSKSFIPYAMKGFLLILLSISVSCSSSDSDDDSSSSSGDVSTSSTADTVTTALESCDTSACDVLSLMQGQLLGLTLNLTAEFTADDVATCVAEVLPTAQASTTSDLSEVGDEIFPALDACSALDGGATSDLAVAAATISSDDSLDYTESASGGVSGTAEGTTLENWAEDLVDSADDVTAVAGAFSCNAGDETSAVVAGISTGAASGAPTAEAQEGAEAGMDSSIYDCLDATNQEAAYTASAEALTSTFGDTIDMESLTEVAIENSGSLTDTEVFKAEVVGGIVEGSNDHESQDENLEKIAGKATELMGTDTGAELISEKVAEKVKKRDGGSELEELLAIAIKIIGQKRPSAIANVTEKAMKKAKTRGTFDENTLVKKAAQASCEAAEGDPTKASEGVAAYIATDDTSSKHEKALEGFESGDCGVDYSSEEDGKLDKILAGFEAKGLSYANMVSATGKRGKAKGADSSKIGKSLKRKLGGKGKDTEFASALNTHRENFGGANVIETCSELDGFDTDGGDDHTEDEERNSLAYNCACGAIQDLEDDDVASFVDQQFGKLPPQIGIGIVDQCAPERLEKFGEHIADSITDVKDIAKIMNRMSKGGDKGGKFAAKFIDKLTDDKIQNILKEEGGRGNSAKMFMQHMPEGKRSSVFKGFTEFAVKKSDPDERNKALVDQIVNFMANQDPSDSNRKELSDLLDEVYKIILEKEEDQNGGFGEVCSEDEGSKARPVLYKDMAEELRGFFDEAQSRNVGKEGNQQNLMTILEDELRNNFIDGRSGAFKPQMKLDPEADPKSGKDGEENQGKVKLDPLVSVKIEVSQQNWSNCIEEIKQKNADTDDSDDYMKLPPLNQAVRFPSLNGDNDDNVQEELLSGEERTQDNTVRERSDGKKQQRGRVVLDLLKIVANENEEEYDDVFRCLVNPPLYADKNSDLEGIQSGFDPATEDSASKVLEDDSTETRDSIRGEIKVGAKDETTDRPAFRLTIKKPQDLCDSRLSTDDDPGFLEGKDLTEYDSALEAPTEKTPQEHPEDSYQLNLKDLYELSQCLNEKSEPKMTAEFYNPILRLDSCHLNGYSAQFDIDTTTQEVKVTGCESGSGPINLAELGKYEKFQARVEHCVKKEEDVSGVIEDIEFGMFKFYSPWIKFNRKDLCLITDDCSTKEREIGVIQDLSGKTLEGEYTIIDDDTSIFKGNALTAELHSIAAAVNEQRRGAATQDLSYFDQETPGTLNYWSDLEERESGGAMPVPKDLRTCLSLTEAGPLLSSEVDINDPVFDYDLLEVKEPSDPGKPNIDIAECMTQWQVSLAEADPNQSPSYEWKKYISSSLGDEATFDVDLSFFNKTSRDSVVACLKLEEGAQSDIRGVSYPTPHGDFEVFGSPEWYEKELPDGVETASVGGVGGVGGYDPTGKSYDADFNPPKKLRDCLDGQRVPGVEEEDVNGQLASDPRGLPYNEAIVIDVEDEEKSKQAQCVSNWMAKKEENEGRKPKDVDDNIRNQERPQVSIVLLDEAKYDCAQDDEGNQISVETDGDEPEFSKAEWEKDNIHLAECRSRILDGTPGGTFERESFKVSHTGLETCAHNLVGLNDATSEVSEDLGSEYVVVSYIYDESSKGTVDDFMSCVHLPLKEAFGDFLVLGEDGKRIYATLGILGNLSELIEDVADQSLPEATEKPFPKLTKKVKEDGSLKEVEVSAEKADFEETAEGKKAKKASKEYGSKLEDESATSCSIDRQTEEKKSDDSTPRDQLKAEGAVLIGTGGKAPKDGDSDKPDVLETNNVGKPMVDYQKEFLSSLDRTKINEENRHLFIDLMKRLVESTIDPLETVFSERMGETKYRLDLADKYTLPSTDLLSSLADAVSDSIYDENDLTTDLEYQRNLSNQYAQALFESYKAVSSWLTRGLDSLNGVPAEGIKEDSDQACEPAGGTGANDCRLHENVDTVLKGLKKIYKKVWNDFDLKDDQCRELVQPDLELTSFTPKDSDVQKEDEKLDFGLKLGACEPDDESAGK